MKREMVLQFLIKSVYYKSSINMRIKYSYCMKHCSQIDLLKYSCYSIKDLAELLAKNNNYNTK